MCLLATDYRLSDEIRAVEWAAVSIALAMISKDRSANGTSVSVSRTDRNGRSDTRAGRAGYGPRFEVPRSFLSTLKAGFSVSAQTGAETVPLAGRRQRDIGFRHTLWMSITGSLSFAA